MKSLTVLLLALGAPFLGCSDQSRAQSDPHFRLVPLTLCDIGRYADYSAVFDIVATKAIDSSNPMDKNQLETTLRVVEPFIPNPENGSNLSSRVSSRDQIIAMRSARPGTEVVAMLALPEGARVGSRVLAFIGLSSGFGVWGDLNYQSVFAIENELFSNRGLYSSSNPVSLEKLRAETLRGSKLPRNDGPSCDPDPVQTVDAGSMTLRMSDGGSR